MTYLHLPFFDANECKEIISYIEEKQSFLKKKYDSSLVRTNEVDAVTNAAQGSSIFENLSTNLYESYNFFNDNPKYIPRLKKILLKTSKRMPTGKPNSNCIGNRTKRIDAATSYAPTIDPTVGATSDRSTFGAAITATSYAPAIDPTVGATTDRCWTSTQHIIQSVGRERLAASGRMGHSWNVRVPVWPDMRWEPAHRSPA